jgi:hypothetical protein
MDEPPTLIKALLTERHMQSHTAFCREYVVVARRIDLALSSTASDGVTIIARAHEFDRLIGSSNNEAARDWRDVLGSIRNPQAALAAAPSEVI